MTCPLDGEGEGYVHQEPVSAFQCGRGSPPPGQKLSIAVCAAIACSLKPRCSPNMPARKILRSIHEGARDMARDIAATEDYVTSRRQRKKVEMLLAHLKRDRPPLGGRTKAGQLWAYTRDDGPGAGRIRRAWPMSTPRIAWPSVPWRTWLGSGTCYSSALR